MTSTIDVIVPRVNANDDQARVVQICVQNGQKVSAGELLFTIETTKATVDVESVAEGTIWSMELAEEDVVCVGQVVARLEVEDDTGELENRAQNDSGVDESSLRRITARARKRARQLGVDLDSLGAGGVIDAAVVEQAYHRQAATFPPVWFDRHDYMRSLKGRRAIVFGGGGHSAVVMDTLALLGVEVLGAVDDYIELGREVLPGRSVIGRVASLGDYLAPQDDGMPCLAFVGVGGQTDNRPRQRVVELLQATGFELPPLVHPSAVIGESVHIGDASCVLAGSVIGPRCRVGSGVIINQAAQLCHDSQVGDFAHLAPGALVAGCCRIGFATTIGMGATVLDHTQVGRACLVHNGASVTGHLADSQELERNGERRRRNE